MAAYLITGGAGFIGSHLCDALIKDHTVYVLDNLSTGSLDNLPKGVEFIQGDVCDGALVKELLSKVDGCFHLAALVSIPLCNENFLDTHAINETGTMTVIKSAQDLKKKNAQRIPIVYASSSAVYGNAKDFPLKETTETRPISLYGLSKLSSEYYGYFANELDHIPFTALRLFNVYGHRQKLTSSYAGVISKFSHLLMQNQPCTIYGDGLQSRDFIYVEDVVQFFIKAMKTSNDAMRVYNVCTGKVTNVNQIATLLSELLNKPLEIQREAAKKGDIYFSQGDYHRAKKQLHIEAQTPIDVGLKELISLLST